MLSEDDFHTTLEDGSEVPLRWFGDSALLAYDHIFPFEFREDVRNLLIEAGEDPNQLPDNDSFTHRWEYALAVDFDSEPPTIQFTDADNWYGVPITVINWW